MKPLRAHILASLLEDLDAFLDKEYPLNGAPKPTHPAPRTRIISPAYEACLDEHLDIHGVRKALVRARQDLWDQLKYLEQLVPHSDALEHLKRVISELDKDIDMRPLGAKLHRGANWMARLIAETCAEHYNVATGKTPTSGTSPEGHNPSTEFGRLVKDALKYVGCDDDWRKPVQAVASAFDPNLGYVPAWPRAKKPDPK